jgi:hypothetical protein
VCGEVHFIENMEDAEVGLICHDCADVMREAEEKEEENEEVCA